MPYHHCVTMNETCNINIADTAAVAETNCKHPSFLQNAISYSTEYTDYSGLHGVRYLGERNRNIWEKLWWMLVLIGSIYVCITLIFESHDKLTNSAIIISFSETPTPVWKIPFPAVTICPQRQCRGSLYNFNAKRREVFSKLNEIPNDELKEFYDAALVCSDTYYPEIPFIPDVPDSINYTVDSKTYKFIEKVAPQLEESVLYCEGLNITATCRQFFTTVITDIGVCFTFNMLDQRDIYRSEIDIGDSMMVSRRRSGWTLDDGYSDYSPDRFPLRALPGRKGDLTIILTASALDQFRNSFSGFRIILHNPGEVPFFTSAKVNAPFSTNTRILVKPDLMVASEELRTYTPESRKCYFSFERTLRYYQNYTQINCETECLTNYTLKACGCIPFYLPHNNSTKVCGYDKILCIDEAQDSHDTHLGGKWKLAACDCMPTCTHTNYNIETTQEKYYLEEFAEVTSEEMDVTFTSINIQLKERQFIAVQRKENYGWVDFIADCGGNLGLFIGFSFLSIFETVYFFSLRIWCNIRRYGRHYWSGSTDLIGLDKECNNKRKYTLQQEDISNNPGDIRLNKVVFINIDEL